MTSSQGETYFEYVNDVLNKENEQRKLIEGRAAVIVTSSASLLTIIFGISVLFTGKDFKFASHVAEGFLLASLVVFVVTAFIGILAQVYHFVSEGTEALESLVGEHWTDSEVDARQRCARIVLFEIDIVRQENITKSRLVAICSFSQVFAVVLLTAAMTVEIASR
jgi:hypothetical protein